MTLIESMEEASMVSRASLAVFAALVLSVTVPLAAHHSVSAEFDSSKPITFTGTVKKVDWMNPHIYTHVETKGPDGKLIVYKVEGGPPNSLYRQGWRKDTLKVGDTVTVSGIRAKIATSNNVGQATITTADGKKYFGGVGPQRSGGAADAPN
jgi:Family of unknown function (DUF6152)